ncbi:hypothetical protein F7725_023397 [Dissostichus mawsoni]|uniref:Uncharacterized protein n=1 Tax=Dissostichus mawsoni TaxID=36200 RepID=A0A7J5Z0L2_DISMA|nr:hypothetical protein F7725_023397 [Dissostichus mawsoni]
MCELKSLILQIAAVWIEEETKELIAAKEAYMSENAPHPDLGGDMAALQVRGILRVLCNTNTTLKY